MTNEQHFILDCISAYIKRENQIIPRNLKWSDINTCSIQHQIAGIVYYQTRCELNPMLEKHYYQSIYAYQNRNKIIDELKQIFQDDAIEFVFLKGGFLAELYPVPALRTMGDLDVLVRKEKRELAHQQLLRSGYKCYSKGENEWGYNKNGFSVELHYALENENAAKRSTKKIDEYLKSIWSHIVFDDEKNEWILEPEYHFIYLLIHLRQHLIGLGVGLRQFIDLAVFLSNGPIDGTRIRKYLIDTGLLSFAEKCCAICEKWFRLQLPIDSIIDDEFYFNVTEEIFRNGVFGYYNEENRVNHIANQELIGKTKFRVMVELLFPSAKDLSQIDGYAFLKKRPFLLPIAWIKRIIRKIKKDSFQSGIELSFSPYLQSKEATNREIYFTQWGL